MSPRPYRAAASHVPPADAAAAAACQRLLDGKTKPRGSLGRLEALACRLAAARGEARPGPLMPAVVLAAADHGVAEEGVSAFPAEVTGQMVANLARGGAALSVLARHAGARVVLLDVGVRHPLPLPEGPLPGGARLHVRRLMPGTDNFTRGPAMPRAVAEDALDLGVGVAHALAAEGAGVVALGELGIGNSTAAAALACALTGAAPGAACGRGTGVDDAGLARKVDAVARALAANRPDAADAVDCLAKVGGLELATLAGVVLGAAERRLVVVADGFIATSAVLAAVRLCPRAADYVLAGHRSVEPGHALLLGALGQAPLLELDLRLGEGTGAVLALHLVEAAVRVLHEMATFEGAGVSDSGA